MATRKKETAKEKALKARRTREQAKPAQRRASREMERESPAAPAAPARRPQQSKLPALRGQRQAPRRAAAAAPARRRFMELSEGRSIFGSAPGQIGRASRSSRRAIEGAKGMEPSGDTRAIQRRKAIAGVKSGASRKAWEALSPAQKRARLVDAGRGRSYRPASVMEADLRLESSKSFIRGMSAAQKRRTALAVAAEKKRQQARKAKKK